MQVKVERFKKLNSVEIPLGGITLLVGGNNSGKSSVLQALQFGVAVAQTSAIQGGTWSADRLATSIGQSDLIYSPIKDVTSLARNGRLREQPSEAITVTYQAPRLLEPDEVPTDANTWITAKILVRKGRNKNVLLEILGKEIGEKLQSIDRPYCALVTGLAGIPAEERYQTEFAVQKAAARGDSNSVFRNILLQLSKSESWNSFNEQLNRVFPGYKLEIKFDPSTDEFIDCQVVKDDGLSYPIDSCGTGVLQAIQIFSYIHLFDPAILLLDEPDSHLHPNNQKMLAEQLQVAAAAGTKIVIATHSRHLVEALTEDADLIWLSNGEIKDIESSYEIKALMEIGALSAGERLLQPDWILLTEDTDTSVIEALLQANGADLSRGEILSYLGSTKVDTALVLLAQLKKTCPDARYIVHRDRDFLDPSQIADYKSKFSGCTVDFLISEGNDLEWYFLTPSHISQALGLTESVANEILTSAFQRRKDDLIKKYINTCMDNGYKSRANPNAGTIAVRCAAEMNSSSSLAVHGKTLLKGLRDELAERKIQDKILTSTSALEKSAIKGLVSVASGME